MNLGLCELCESIQTVSYDYLNRFKYIKIFLKDLKTHIKFINKTRCILCMLKSFSAMWEDVLNIEGKLHMI